MNSLKPADKTKILITRKKSYIIQSAENEKERIKTIHCHQNSLYILVLSEAVKFPAQVDEQL